MFEHKASKSRKHNPCVGLIAMLPDTASLVFPPTLVRSAYNWLHCLWIQSCSSSNRNHLFAVVMSSGNRKSVSHLCLSVLFLCPLSLFTILVYGKTTNKETQTLLVLPGKVESGSLGVREDVPAKCSFYNE